MANEPMAFLFFILDRQYQLGVLVSEDERTDGGGSLVKKKNKFEVISHRYFFYNFDKVIFLLF